jgi:hypothetical protein
MADDGIIDLSARRAAKQQAADSIDDEVLEGYKIAYSEDGRVMIVFVTGDQEYTVVLDHEAARRLGRRVCIGAERAKRCLGSKTSGA